MLIGIWQWVVNGVRHLLARVKRRPVAPPVPDPVVLGLTPAAPSGPSEPDPDPTPLEKRWTLPTIILSGILPAAPAPAPEPDPEPLRTLLFRDYEWLQRAPTDERGRVTFYREVAVDGRAVASEVTLLAADLILTPDGAYILGERT